MLTAESPAGVILERQDEIFIRSKVTGKQQTLRFFWGDRASLSRAISSPRFLAPYKSAHSILFPESLVELIRPTDIATSCGSNRKPHRWRSSLIVNDNYPVPAREDEERVFCKPLTS